jgi:hypothetical protein
MSEEGGVPPVNNGNVFDNYYWTQNHKDVSIHIPLQKNIRCKDIEVKFNPLHLYVKIRDQDSPVINGNLFSKVKAENCTWIIENSCDSYELIVELDKKKFDEWWKYAIEGEPQIDLSKIVTGQGSIDDLDQETRMTIDKMLYEQRIKEQQGFYDRK